MDPVRPLEHLDPLNDVSTGKRGAEAPALSELVLSDIAHLLVSESSPDRVLEAVADGLRKIIPYDTLTLFRADPVFRVLRPALARDTYAEEILKMGAISYGDGITGSVASTGTPQMVNDAHADPRAKPIPNTGAGQEPQALIAIPLLAREELKGVLCLYRLGHGNHFSEVEFGLATRFGEMAALAIDNAQIRARLEAEVVTDHLTGLYNHRYFHERLAEEMRRANRRRSSVGLLIADIDDFKLVNDTYGHLVGDQILQGVSSLFRETCRLEDIVCRIGGEEFAVILPGCNVADALVVGERIRSAIGGMPFPGVGRVTVSLGIAEGPAHASSPRELVACTDLALLDAKMSGKDRTCVFADSSNGSMTIPGSGRGEVAKNGNGQVAQARLAVEATRGEARSLAQLRMLHSLASKLNRSNDVTEIGEVITAELRSLIDYHNCRVYLLQPDGETLAPIAFRGALSEYQGETFDALVLKVGEGVTGHVAVTGQSYYTPDAENDSFAVTIPGTPDLDESLLSVPLAYGDQVIGVVTLSKLGLDQFDDEDRRLLEVLASNAAVAFQNARLLQEARESAETSTALLRLSEVLVRPSDVPGVLSAALAAIPGMIPCAGVQAWLRDRQAAGFRLAGHLGFEAGRQWLRGARFVPNEMAEPLISSMSEPFVVPRDVVGTIPQEYRWTEDARDVLVAPIRWEPHGLGCLVIVAPTVPWAFSDRDLRLARGIADIGSLGLGNAARFDELERTYMSTVEALANAVEAKDAYTGDHCRALAEMSLAVGSELGLPWERKKVLELGALFHDIGKIGVASEIIRKPAALTAAERREMNRHPEIGARILEPVAFLQPVRPIIHASHERWDGNGYPRGLKGEEIPLESRIIFVCDAFHAMTTDRPYRMALPEREAIRRLKLAAGTQFDPGVVATFVRLLRAGGIAPHNGH